jgi:hypothetical protein
MPGCRRIVLACAAAGALAAPAQAAVTVDDRLAFTRADGSAVAFAREVRVWCGRWERDVPVRTLHVRVGGAGALWHLRAVVADVRRRPVVRLPHEFVFDEPSGAHLFAADGENELSSLEEEGTGRITFERVRCGRRLAVRFRVRGELGSEFFDGPRLAVRGSFSARR